MASITLKMRDGTERAFKHEGRSGGSFTKRLKYEPGFVVIIDEYCRETAIAADLILEINVYPVRE